MGKNNIFIALLLFATTFNSYGMEKPEKVKSTPIEIIANILLGAEEFNPRKLSLPPENQYEISNLLFTKSNTNSLAIAANSIKSLSLVNKELNELIDDPQFCLQLIKHLAIKFNCSDQQAAEALQTKEAQRQLKLQMLLHTLCIADSLKNLPSLESIVNQGVDLNFTYTTLIHDFFPTPLMLASAMDTGLLEKLCSVNPELININQRNLDGETAFFLAIGSGLPSHIKTLLDAGADPEIADINDFTPLQLAQRMHNQEIIKLIQDAINKKHGKK